jgi:hypothetical protein
MAYLEFVDYTPEAPPAPSRRRESEQVEAEAS